MSWTKMLHGDRATWPPERGPFLVYDEHDCWYIGNRNGIDPVTLNDEWSAHATESIWWHPLPPPPAETA